MSYPTRAVNIVLLILITFSLGACANRFTAPMHALITKNVGSDLISRVDIEYGIYRFRDITPKYPGQQQTDIGDRRVPSSMKVSWLLVDGRQFEKVVPLHEGLSLTGAFAGYELQFNGEHLEIFRLTHDPQSPLSDTKSHLYP